jgi:hypothetical protein
VGLDGCGASAVTHGRLLVIAETDGSRSVEDDLVRGMTDRQRDGLVYGCLATRTVELDGIFVVGRRYREVFAGRQRVRVP